jgi:hypothetical protein
MSYQSVNPYDGKRLKTFKELTDKQLDKALETAAACFETWRRKTYAAQNHRKCTAVFIQDAQSFSSKVHTHFHDSAHSRSGPAGAREG